MSALPVSDRELERYGESFLLSFEAIRRALALYPGNHPKVDEQLQRFVRNLHELHDRVGDSTVNVIHREFFINGLPLKRLSLNYARSLAAWEGLGLGLVRFGRDTTPASALRFFEAITKSPEEIAQRGGVAALMAELGVQGVKVTGVASELASDVVPVFEEVALQGVEASSPAEARSRFLDSKAELGSIVDQVWGTASHAERMIRTARRLVERRIAERRPVQELLARLKEHHAPSWRHALDGAVLAVLIGRALGLTRDRLSVLGEAAALRDVGKIEIDRALLDSPPAGEDGQRELARHTELGAKLLFRTREVDASAGIVAYEHHARFDGRGLPRIASRKGPHAFTRLVAVASDYDEMTSGEGVLPAEAMRRLWQGAGSAWDPAAVRAFLSLVGLYPEGTAVELQDGSYGVVAGPGRTSWAQPEVVLLRDGTGREVEPGVWATSDRFPGPEPAVVAAFPPTRDDIERLEPLRIL